ncbi:MAG: ABC transporter substrate-binding protein [Anaerolineae bacterium]|jgi:branched-chain amino acid transport system substrate-binding protein
MRSRPILILVVLATLISMTACQGADGGDGAGEPLKIAILAPLSGDVATFGESTRDGALLAIEEWNERGGVLGREIEPIVEDSQCQAEAAVSAGNKVIDQDGVSFIIGEVCSSASIPLSEVVVSKGVLQMSPTSTNPDVTLMEDGSTKETVFRACFIDPFQGTVAARFALENLEAQTAAVFLDQGNDYVRGLAEFFREAFEAGGGEVVVWETYTGEDQDFSAILTKVRDASPDLLYLPDYYSTVNLIAAQAQEMGVEATMMGGDGWDSADLDRAVVEGGYYTNHYSGDDPRPIVQEWVEKYTEKYGAEPDALATLAYDAANILLQAIEEAGTDDPAAVAETLEGMEFSVVSGNIVYDEQHNPVKSAVVLQVSGGEIQYIDTISP